MSPVCTLALLDFAPPDLNQLILGDARLDIALLSRATQTHLWVSMPEAPLVTLVGPSVFVCLWWVFLPPSLSPQSSGIGRRLMVHIPFDRSDRRVDITPGLGKAPIPSLLGVGSWVWHAPSFWEKVDTFHNPKGGASIIYPSCPIEAPHEPRFEIPCAPLPQPPHLLSGGR